MDIIRAKQLLDGLLQGINPLTGEKLPDDHLCNQGEMVRAFYCINEELKRIKHKNKKPKTENAGFKWTDEEEETVVKNFENGMSITEIAKIQKRSNLAIETRLFKLGKLDKAGVLNR